MELLAGLAGAILAALVLIDVFVALVLPATLTWRIRPSRTLYVATWLAWRAPARRRGSHYTHATYLGWFGPMSLFILILIWSVGLVFAFALIYWALGPGLKTADGSVTFFTHLYMSGTTMFTLGMGDVTPVTPAARFLTVVQAATGLAFLAVVVGYLPVLYQSFSRREVYVTLLCAQAGIPPSAAELLRRYAEDDALGTLHDILRDSERWVAELLETHVSHPTLAYYRSQRADESWLAVLTTILDLTTLILVGVPQAPVAQARRAFEVAQTTVVELRRVIGASARAPTSERLSTTERARLRTVLSDAGVLLPAGDEADAHLDELRRLYEPHVAALADYFVLTLPTWVPPPHVGQASERAAATAAGAPATSGGVAVSQRRESD